MEAALDIEIAMKEPCPPTAGEDRHTKKVKIRDKVNDLDLNMDEKVDKETDQQEMSDQHMLTEGQQNENNGVVVPMDLRSQRKPPYSGPP